MQIKQWIDQARSRLQTSEHAKREAEMLLGFVTGKSRSFILAFEETWLTDIQLPQLEGLLQRRVQGEPMAYLIGEREFWSLPLEVSPVTLIPRPDTECLVEKALTLLPHHQCEILDLGCGCGTIALAIASIRRDCQVIGVDNQISISTLATRNAQRLAIENVRFETGSWFEPVVNRRYTLIVSNPPYIDPHDPHLQCGDVRFEPLSALVAAEQGLADLRHIIAQAPAYLLVGGWLLLEHGWQQGNIVRNLLMDQGFRQVKTGKDYGRNDRISFGQWQG